MTRTFREEGEIQAFIDLTRIGNASSRREWFSREGVEEDGWELGQIKRSKFRELMTGSREF